MVKILNMLKFKYTLNTEERRIAFMEEIESACSLMSKITRQEYSDNTVGWIEFMPNVAVENAKKGCFWLDDIGEMAKYNAKKIEINRESDTELSKFYKTETNEHKYDVLEGYTVKNSVPKNNIYISSFYTILTSNINCDGRLNDEFIKDINESSTSIDSVTRSFMFIPKNNIKEFLRSVGESLHIKPDIPFLRKVIYLPFNEYVLIGRLIDQLLNEDSDILKNNQIHFIANSSLYVIALQLAILVKISGETKGFEKQHEARIGVHIENASSHPGFGKEHIEITGLDPSLYKIYDNINDFSIDLKNIKK